MHCHFRHHFIIMWVKFSCQEIVRKGFKAKDSLALRNMLSLSSPAHCLVVQNINTINYADIDHLWDRVQLWLKIRLKMRHTFKYHLVLTCNLRFSFSSNVSTICIYYVKHWILINNWSEPFKLWFEYKDWRPFWNTSWWYGNLWKLKYRDFNVSKYMNKM